MHDALILNDDIIGRAPADIDYRNGRVDAISIQRHAIFSHDDDEVVPGSQGFRNDFVKRNTHLAHSMRCFVRYNGFDGQFQAIRFRLDHLSTLLTIVAVKRRDR